MRNNEHLDSGPECQAGLAVRARRRVARKIGFYIHAAVFTLVNLGLFAINALTGDPHWAIFPLMGWGLGLAIHGVVTVIGLLGGGMRRSMVRREIRHLRRSEG